MWWWSGDGGVCGLVIWAGRGGEGERGSEEGRGKEIHHHHHHPLMLAAFSTMGWAPCLVMCQHCTVNRCRHKRGHVLCRPWGAGYGLDHMCVQASGTTSVAMHDHHSPGVHVCVCMWTLSPFARGTSTLHHLLATLAATPCCRWTTRFPPIHHHHHQHQQCHRLGFEVRIAASISVSPPPSSSSPSSSSPSPPSPSSS